MGTCRGLPHRSPNAGEAVRSEDKQLPVAENTPAASGSLVPAEISVPFVAPVVVAADEAVLSASAVVVEHSHAEREHTAAGVAVGGMLPVAKPDEEARVVFS